jgi:hypothetical protein
MLTDDEATVLGIAVHGERMIPIGRWKAPVESLIAKGFLKAQPQTGDASGQFNNVITDAGRIAVNEWDKQSDEKYRQILETGTKINNARQHSLKAAEEAAQYLVVAVETAVSATGDTTEVALAKWLKAIELRAKEILKND